VQTLVSKAVRAATVNNIPMIVLGGGVAANSELRETVVREGNKAGVQVVIPPFRSCTDNAAMIAYAGVARLERGEDDRGKLEVSPRTTLPRATRKGKGRRPAPKTAIRSQLTK
jgi:N6-L-threonylcarbamoyladenine synthase